ncbi:MAG TPA: putative ABC exporter domain-containing protein [Gemmatimonadaceae bacterium]|nr:putative ABC exporter domain-containing protein [Gemmatimonadaceae bacterium]
MIDALLYLTRTSIWNRLAVQARRLRQPRYAIALVLGAVYFWVVLLRPASQPSRAPTSLWNNAETITALGILLLMLGGWVFRGERMALAFTPAEVQFLFAAPLTRRGLISFKLFRSQLVILFNAVIWVFVLRRSGSVLAAPLRFVGTWMLFSNLSLHRLGAALVRTSLVEHGRPGIRRHLPAVILGTAGAVAVLLILRDAVPAIRAARGAGEITHAIEHAADLPAARALLFVPRLIVSPSFAQSTGEWMQAAGASLLILLVQLVWVIQSDVAFEEAAVQASVERARRLDARRRRSGQANTGTNKKAKRTIPLRPSGLPGGAIVWKNTLLLMRTGRVGSVIGLALMAIVLSLPAVESRGIDSRFIAIAALVMVVLLIVLGSRVLQNDFRQDAEHVPALKTLPISGAQLVGAEVVSSALPISLLQIALVVVAYVATLGDDGLPISLSLRTGILLMSPLMLITINATTVTIQNAAALLFPGWVRVTPVVGGGVETMGQGILVTGVLLLTFLLALLPAAAVFGVVWWLLAGLPNGWILALLAAAAVLLGETWWAVRGLGRRFEKLEPAQGAA